MSVMEFHEVANIFPMMNGEEYADLLEDIRQNGLREPVWTYEGKIIDGRNRWRACQELGIEPALREWNGNGSLVAFVVSLNLKRRHLSSSQKAVVALGIEKALAVEAKRNMTAGGVARVQGFQKIENPEVHAAEQAAVLVGTNRQYVSDAKRIAKDAPDVLEVVRDGRVSIPDGKRIASLPVEARRDVIKQIDAGEVKDVKDAVRVARAALPAQPRQEYLAPVPARLEIADARRLPLGDESVDLIVTSPPYGLDIPYAGSTDPSENWYAFMGEWLAEAYRVAKLNGRIALNVPLDTTLGGKRPTYAQSVSAAIMAGWVYQWSIVWAEGNVSKSIARGSVDSASAPHVIAPVEMIAVFSKGGWLYKSDVPSDLAHEEWLTWTNGLWTFPGEGRSWEGHPAPFPEELPRRLVKLLSYPGDTVLDPFAGSGTTPLVAWRLGRQAVGFDVAPEYIASARRRLASAIGQRHENTTAA